MKILLKTKSKTILKVMVLLMSVMALSYGTFVVTTKEYKTSKGNENILKTYQNTGIKLISDLTSTVTQSEINTSLTTFYNTLEKTNDYIYRTDKFNCTEEGCTTSEYTNIGLISTYEYERIGGLTSYLGSNNSYFSINNGVVENITSTGIESTTTSTSSGLRPVVYLQNDVTVTGSGTAIDPFRLEPKGDIKLVSATLNGEALDSFPLESDPYIVNEVTCTNGTEGYWDTERNSLRLTTINLPTTCTVDFTEGYTVTMASTGGTVGAPASVVVGRTGTTTFTVTVNTGYTTEGSTISCTGNATGTLNGSTVTVKNIDSTQTCTLAMKAKTYGITLTNTNATTGGTTSVTATYNSSTISPTTITIPVRKYTVSGFGLASNRNSTGATVSSTATLTSTYTFNGWYTATSGGSKVINNSSTPSYVASVSGYTNASGKWTKDGAATLYAQWTSATVKLPTITKTGYTCGWTTSSTGTTIVHASGATITPTANTTLYGVCVIKTYAVKVSSTNTSYGTVTPTSTTVNHGSAATITLTPASGYEYASNTCGGTISGNTMTISNVTAAKTCTVTFSKTNKLYDQLLADNPTRLTRSDFSTVFTDSNTKTLYTVSGNWTEDGSTVYYFAGNAQNNWVKFGKDQDGADLYWRIIRTNEDGSIRMLYVGTATDTTSAFPVLDGVSLSGGSDTTGMYNSAYTDPMYVGYMYGTSWSLANNRKNTTSSPIKTVIDSWYSKTLNTKTDGTYTYDSYVSKTAIYCNDRSTDEYSTTDSMTYGAYDRLYYNKQPSYKCGNDATGTLYSTADVADKFSVSTTNGGNGDLTYGIALMTADEIAFAGGKAGTSAAAWYYYNSAGKNVAVGAWWTMSPSGTSVSGSRTNPHMFYVEQYSSGTYPGYFNGHHGTDSNSGGARPVISLKSCIGTTGGNGSSSNPYTVKVNASCATSEN